MKKASPLCKSVCVAILFLVLAQTTLRAQTTQISTSADFNRARLSIDSLDKQLIKLIGERERVVKAIGLYKAKNNIPPLQAARFQQVLDKAKKAGESEGLSAEFVEDLMNAIHKESLKIENSVKEGNR
ncbi:MULTISPECIES: chorismate mutase [unclassified Mucilaginibacter]|uniref:chorismate mutase n=1 Tax=unclassified Mucilaginibacter TaxID=2617802 RepID=UPI0009608B2F|nr:MULTISPECIES: chorismate mutase [unclassified Mucilaginibacter]OJW18376.1 MAG: hypothetical protein BGO48_17685 [Mucilaginibacter sp. 44-25]PLW88311.1 MAG: hypothetical protein C0154_17265 [Mucilaginibacter sp.]PMP65215.1 MAG: hypothetical protein C0191_04165 [Mucilaginibacter sp.]HEK19214.1 hypothetical protein [Bacteroidota bacterium]